LRVEFAPSRPPAASSDLVPDPIEESLPEIGLKGSFPRGFKDIHSIKRLEQGFLNKILRVCDISGPLGEAVARPTAECREIAAEQTIECFTISCSMPLNQAAGGFCFIGNEGF
jgi:hypothetical protein